MDEVAHETGQDALAFRQKAMTQHPLALAVLNKAASMAGWGKPAEEGRHLGLAVDGRIGLLGCQMSRSKEKFLLGRGMSQGIA